MYLEIEADVLEFLNEIQTKSVGYKVYLGGGYLRDLYVSNTTPRKLDPKDIDVFLIPVGEEKHTHIPARGWKNFSKEAREIPDMQDRGVKRVSGYWFPRLETSDVQFIEYEYFMTGEELAEDMDMGINQIMYDVSCNCFLCSDNFLTDHEEEMIRCTHEYDKLRMYKRFVRMEDKFYWYTSENKPELNCEELMDLARIIDHDGSFCDEDVDETINDQEGVDNWR